MNDPVTVGDILWSLAVFGGGVIVIGIAGSILAAIAKGFTR